MSTPEEQPRRAAPDPSGAGLGPTYRLQLHPGFGFADAARTVPYLARLGIATLYLSPIAEAVPGSTHGYDAVDPTRLRDELGGDAGFRALADGCRARGLGICVDHVPNHLAAWPGGGWWRRLLAEGPDSPIGEVFDVDWHARAPRAAGAPARAGDRKVTVPVLDRPLGEALRQGRVRLGARGDEPVIDVGAPGERGVDLPVSGGTVRDGEDVAEVLASQHYRLVDWHDAADRNYRRFFDIDGLAGVRVEVPEVFDATHALLLSLADAGHLTAIRIDHVDGLREPAAYLRRLAARTDLPIVVEKILTGDEPLRAQWPVLGTTGYEVVDDIGGTFVDAHGYDRVVAAGRSEGDAEVEPLTVDTRRLVATTSFPGEIARLAAQLGVDGDALRELVVRLPRYRTYLSGTDGATDAEEAALWRRVATRAASTPDVDAPGATAARGAEDLQGVVDALLDARALPVLLGLQQLTGALMAKGVEDTAWYRLAGPLAFCEVGGDPGRSRHDAVSRWHARAARRGGGMHGLVPGTTHDTKRSLDVRCRLYALCEIATGFDEGLDRFRRALDSAVGADAGAPAVAETLAYETRVLAQLALGILPPLPPPAAPSPPSPPSPSPPSPLSPLSPPPTGGVRPAAGGASSHVGAGARREPGAAGDAAWPVPASTLGGRLGDALAKGARESKRRSSWRAPNEAHEARLRALAEATLADGGALLRASFGPVVGEVARLGAVCSLGAVVLRHGVPGIPDCYQGDEVWNLSLVDPDNRRPVDFEHLSSSLASLEAADNGTGGLRHAADRRREWRDGTVKLLVTARCLAARRGPAGAALSPSARYHPLAARGAAATSVLAFAREARSETGEATWAIAVVTRLAGRLTATAGDLPAGASYAHTVLPLPDGAPARFVDAISGAEVVARGGTVALEEVLAALPVALLLAAPVR